MTLLDLYWMENDDWYHFEGFKAVINDDAPPEAQESYKTYLEQLKTKKDKI